MRYFLAVIVCLFCSLGVFAQMENGKATDEIKVEKTTLAREDKDGNISDDLSSFKPTDIPIYCYIDLNSTKPVNVKMQLIAVKAKGLRANLKFIDVSYKTKDGENNVGFTASPKKVWAVGDYRVDIFLNGKLADSKEFKIENSEKKD